MAETEERIRCAVIGVGHLGRHHARILAELEGVRLVGVVDRRLHQAREVAAPLGTQALEDFRPLLGQLDAAVVAVPTSLHYPVAASLLQRGVAVLVEKPLAANLREADALLRMADDMGVTLQVGHVERFNAACRALSLVRSWGPPQCIQATREVPYSFRSTDIGAVLDLMIHDLDLILWIVGQFPVGVRAYGWSHFGGHEDLAMAVLEFPSGTVAQCLASRVSGRVRRELQLYWPHHQVVLDFVQGTASLVEPTEFLHRELPLFVHPPADQVPRLRQKLFSRYFQRRDLACPPAVEPLRLELEHFIRCVRTHEKPLVSGREGRDAVAVAEAVLEAASTGTTRQPLPFVQAA